MGIGRVYSAVFSHLLKTETIATNLNAHEKLQFQMRMDETRLIRLKLITNSNHKSTRARQRGSQTATEQKYNHKLHHRQQPAQNITDC